MPGEVGRYTKRRSVGLTAPGAAICERPSARPGNSSPMKTERAFYGAPIGPAADGQGSAISSGLYVASRPMALFMAPDGVVVSDESPPRHLSRTRPGHGTRGRRSRWRRIPEVSRGAVTSRPAPALVDRAHWRRAVRDDRGPRAVQPGTPYDPGLVVPLICPQPQGKVRTSAPRLRQADADQTLLRPAPASTDNTAAEHAFASFIHGVAAVLIKRVGPQLLNSGGG